MTTTHEMTTMVIDQHADLGGPFVRLVNSRDKITGAFWGEPVTRVVVWTGERYVRFDANNSAHWAAGPGLLVLHHFYVPSEGAMKVLRGGLAWYHDVLRVFSRYGLYKRTFEIERCGDASDPRAFYRIRPVAELDDALRARIAAAKTPDLAAIADVMDGGGK